MAVAELVASDPGAWNIIGWMLVLAVVGGAIMWVATTLMLRAGRSADAQASSPPRPPA